MIRWHGRWCRPATNNDLNDAEVEVDANAMDTDSEEEDEYTDASVDFDVDEDADACRPGRGCKLPANRLRRNILP